MSNKDLSPREGFAYFLVCLGIALIILSMGGCEMLLAKAKAIEHAAEQPEQAQEKR